MEGFGGLDDSQIVLPTGPLWLQIYSSQNKTKRNNGNPKDSAFHFDLRYSVQYVAVPITITKPDETAI